MLEKVLVPTDGSERAMRAVKYAKDLLKQGLIKKVTILHVKPAVEEHWEHYGLGNLDFEFKYRCVINDDAKRILRISEDVFESEGLPVETVFLCGDISETIVNYAEENQFNLIIMGNQGLTRLGELLLGSVCDRVIRQVSIPVMIIK